MNQSLSKNILLYTDTPQVGGAELQMFLLAKFLNKEKFTPLLACSKNPELDKWCENFEQENIKVIRINASHKHSPAHYFQLKKIIKEEKISLLHTHIWNPASCRYAYMAAKKTGIPLITTEHDPFKLSYIKNLLKKRWLKNVSQIVTVSENNAQILKKLYPKTARKIDVILNGIDTTWWESQLLRFTPEDREEIRGNLFKTGENTLIIICVAELHERKGQKYLINAHKNIHKKFPNTKLVFVGDGPDRPNLERLVRKLKLDEQIAFTGRQKILPKIFKSADIFVLPSLREAFGLVLCEAMTVPLPIIASETGGIPEVIADGKTGILVPPANSEKLAKALTKILLEKDLRDKLAENEKQSVTEEFDAKIMAAKYEGIYEKFTKQ